MAGSGWVLLHMVRSRRVPLDPADVFFLEADGDETLVRTHRARTLRDVRSLGQVMAAFKRHGFVRVHRSLAVNPRRVRELRPRGAGGEWELRLQPPVNRVLRVSRAGLKALLAVFD